MTNTPPELWSTVRGAQLSQVERLWLIEAASAVAEHFDSPLILNVGIYRGASMHCLRAGAPAAALVGIDVYTRKVQEPEMLRAELIRKDSRQMKSWARVIHLLFLDGGHREEVVLSDIATFGKHVAPGGLMALHDYHRDAQYLRERQRLRPSRAPLGVHVAADKVCTGARGWILVDEIDSIGAFRKA